MRQGLREGLREGLSEGLSLNAVSDCNIIITSRH